MKKHIRFAVLATSLLFLASCSSDNNSIPTQTLPEIPSADPTISSLLPTGSYTVTGVFNSGNESSYSTKLEGYVDFGSATDGQSCQQDYKISDTTKNHPKSIIETKRSLGEVTFSRDLSKQVPGKWVDIANISEAPGISFMFIPYLIASDHSAGVFNGAGTGILCSIPIISRFGKLENNIITLDENKSKKIILARTKTYADKFLLASGVKGKDFNESSRKLIEISRPDFTQLILNTKMIINKDENGVYTLEQSYKDRILVTLTFAPSEKKIVKSVSTTSYFAYLASKSSDATAKFVVNDINARSKG